MCLKNILLVFIKLYFIYIYIVFMIEQVTNKVSGTTFLEIIVILLVILVALIMISNLLLKKRI